MTQAKLGTDRLEEFRVGALRAVALQMVAKLGIAELLADGPRGVHDLGEATSTDPDALHRLLRMLAACGVFTEVAPGQFGLLPLGEQLRDDHPQSIRGMLLLEELVGPVFGHTMHSLRTGESAFPVAFGQPIYEFLRNRPAQSAIFGKAVAEVGRADNAAVLAACDFTDARTVVDVGGGGGALLETVLAAYPESSGVLFDQPEVIDSMRGQFTVDGLAGRCRLVSGDFFLDTWPDGDSYLMKSVIHNWSDAQAVDILRNGRKAMSSASRLLLIERVVPPGDVPHPSKDMDLFMLVVLGGRERTREEYAALLDQADLRLRQVVDTAADVSVIEAVPR